MRPRWLRGRLALGVGALVVVVVGVALVIVVQGIVAHRGDDSANGSIPVRSVAALRGTWTSVNDIRAPYAVVPGSRVALTFDGAKVRATTGCNTLTGTVRVVDSTLVVEGLVGTEMGCEPELMQQEQWVGQMLAARPRLELSGPTLSLLWGDHWLGLSSEVAR